MLRIASAVAFGGVLLSGCNGPSKEVVVNQKFEIASSSFEDGQPIPLKYTAYADNVSPAFAWRGAPPGTKSVVLRLDDPDAVRNPPFVHWQVANLPPEGKIEEGKLPPGAIRGRHDRGEVGYFGPRAPEGTGTHRYRFRFYALDIPWKPKEGFTKEEASQAMEGHVLAEGSLAGTFEKR